MLTTLFFLVQNSVSWRPWWLHCTTLVNHKINRKSYDIAGLKNIIKVKRAKVPLQKHLRIHNSENLEIVAEIKRE